MSKYIRDNPLIGKIIVLYSKSYLRSQFVITIITECSKLNKKPNEILLDFIGKCKIEVFDSNYLVFTFHIMQCFERCELLTNGLMS